MIGWTPKTETSIPFHNPRPTATPRAMPIAVMTVPAPAGSVAEAMWAQASAPLTATTAPTERSMPREAITSVMPRATSMVGAPLRRMSIRLPKRWPSWTRMLRKLGVRTTLTASSATSASAGHSSGDAANLFIIGHSRRR